MLLAEGFAIVDITEELWRNIMDVVQFQEKLREICDLGKQNGNMLTHEQIREHFASTDLETSQMVKVLQYLKLQGISIEGDQRSSYC